MTKTPIFVTFPWAFMTPGGGEQQLMKYVEYLAGSPYQPILFDSWNPGDFSKEKHFVHFFSCQGGSSHTCRYFINTCFKLVSTASLWITESNKNDYGIDEIRDQLDLSTMIITNSKAESNELANILNLPINKFVAIYNGYDNRFLDIRSLRSHRYAQHESFHRTVICMANIEPRKRQFELVQAVKSLNSVTLILAGSVRDQEYFATISPLLSDRIKYIGRLDHLSDKMLHLLSIADLFVLPSTLETPGIAALEAAAAGVPVLITSEGSTSEYFGSHVRYISPNASPSELSAAISEALSCLTAVPIASIKDYSWPIIAQSLQRAYARIE